MLEYLEKVIEQ